MVFSKRVDHDTKHERYKTQIVCFVYVGVGNRKYIQHPTQ